MSQPAKQYDESLVNFYDEQLVSQADTIYRFAFALTLSLEGALECVRRTFRDVTSNLEKARGQGEANSTALLIGNCWGIYKSIKGQKFAEGQSAVTKALKPMTIEARAALVSVDVAGLTPEEAAKALDWPEKTFRGHLATARRQMMKSNVDL